VTIPGKRGIFASKMHPLLEDPWIAAQVDAAMTPYAGSLSAEDVAWMRDQLAETLAGDEKAALLLRRACPVQVQKSGEVRRDSGHDVARRGQKKVG
jgi:hypothetical protein